ncbi:hypothetical protein JCM10908_004793 [Rhodotorula pacifica]|uniref:uncharacterized protein n=1 Tax=Rhodotorula pacifica TaxID=1495444 RepID=UPI00317DA649
MQLPASQTASSLLLSARPPHRFSSACPGLDRLLTPKHAIARSQASVADAEETGLGEGEILELLGPPGIGKTRTAMAFAIAERFRENAGEVLVVDAEGSLSPALIRQTVEAQAAHSGDDPGIVQEVLEGIRYRRIDSDWLMQAIFLTLEEYLAEHPKINLVVIDSLSSHIRPTLDSSTRALMTDTIRTVLYNVCASSRVSVIVTTQMSLKLFGLDHRATSWSRDAEALLVPQISERWLPTDASSSRVLLYYDQDGERLARLLSAPTATQATEAAFTMDLLGPCDYPSMSNQAVPVQEAIE